MGAADAGPSGAGVDSGVGTPGGVTGATDGGEGLWVAGGSGGLRRTVGRGVDIPLVGRFLVGRRFVGRRLVGFLFVGLRLVGRFLVDAATERSSRCALPDNSVASNKAPVRL